MINNMAMVWRLVYCIIEVGADGSKYEGHYAMGKKFGKGKYKWVDDSYFDGQWSNNLITGFGVYCWSDGRKYEGDWLNNNMHG